MMTVTGTDVQRRWVTRLQVMEYLQVGSPTTLRKLIDEDDLPVHFLRNEMRFDVDEVDGWLRSRCSDQTAEVAA